jgi:hypothetical protein
MDFFCLGFVDTENVGQVDLQGRPASLAHPVSFRRSLLLFVSPYTNCDLDHSWVRTSFEPVAAQRRATSATLSFLLFSHDWSPACRSHSITGIKSGLLDRHSPTSCDILQSALATEPIATRAITAVAQRSGPTLRPQSSGYRNGLQGARGRAD